MRRVPSEHHAKADGKGKHIGACASPSVAERQGPDFRDVADCCFPGHVLQYTKGTPDVPFPTLGTTPGPNLGVAIWADSMQHALNAKRIYTSTQAHGVVHCRPLGAASGGVCVQGPRCRLTTASGPKSIKSNVSNLEFGISRGRETKKAKMQFCTTTNSTFLIKAPSSVFRCSRNSKPWLKSAQNHEMTRLSFFA